MEWINMTQERVQWRDIENIVVKILGYVRKVENVLTS